MKIKLLLPLLIPFWVVSACSGFDPQAYVPGLFTPTPSPFTPIPSPGLLIGTPAVTPALETAVSLVVCTNIPGGRLHVRFDPGDDGDVRGYLAESEMVIPGGETTQLESARWIQLSHPIVGWVNAKYLCEVK